MASLVRVEAMRGDLRRTRRGADESLAIWRAEPVSEPPRLTRATRSHPYSTVRILKDVIEDVVVCQFRTCRYMQHSMYMKAILPRYPTNILCEFQRCGVKLIKPRPHIEMNVMYTLCIHARCQAAN